MSEIVNLRRLLAQALLAFAGAAANRAAFGVPKAAKREARAERELVERRLDDHRLADSGDGE
jgi:hypothetical protein